MPTSIPRIAYFAQTGVLTTSTKSYTIPINSANIEVTRPIEAVTAFGQFNSLNTAQTNITTCKSTMKAYLGTGNNINGFTKEVLDDLIAETQSGKITVAVGPNGFEMEGILSNIGIDIALGGFAMIDLGFAGVGTPIIAKSDTSVTNPIHTSADPMTISPVTTMSIGSGEALSGIFATSLKFSYDLPTDTLGALGENPNARQSDMRSIIATKAPYKTTISVEGYGIDITESRLDKTITGVFGIGNIGVSLPKAKITTRSVNNAAGQVSATFSISAEDVGATFVDYTNIVNPYDQDFVQDNLPMYGG